MSYPSTLLEPIKYCPLCGQLVPDFDDPESQDRWMTEHRLVFTFVEVLSHDNYQPSDDEPF